MGFMKFRVAIIRVNCLPIGYFRSLVVTNMPMIAIAYARILQEKWLLVVYQTAAMILSMYFTPRCDIKVTFLSFCFKTCAEPKLSLLFVSSIEISMLEKFAYFIV